MAHKVTLAFLVLVFIGPGSNVLECNYVAAVADDTEEDDLGNQRDRKKHLTRELNHEIKDLETERAVALKAGDHIQAEAALHKVTQARSELKRISRIPYRNFPLDYQLGDGGFLAVAGNLDKSKDRLTPAFSQIDPVAQFAGDGSKHCAPVAVSGGLIFLSKAFDWSDLVPGTDHGSQIELVEELASVFGTDHVVGGTNQDQVLTGLQNYITARGYVFDRLELQAWRVVSQANKPYRTAIKPDGAWIHKAVRSNDTVVVFNFGWYRRHADYYVREGGHWVNVVDFNGKEFVVRNPVLRHEKQFELTAVELTRIERVFKADTGTARPASDSGIFDGASRKVDLRGFYEGSGPGLPHADNVTPVLDAVIVFSLKKPGRPVPRVTGK